ncbi:MAG: HAD family hydrolase [Acidobacteriia bacterium]|nr:HAD family hydrolase [Terriglobia bacterium]
MANSSFVVGFDADDTLWHNESIFEQTHQRFRECLAAYHDAATVDRSLIATERRNLELYGYGIKGFTLSAIETAIQLTEGRISSEEIGRLLELGRNMMAHPVHLMPHAEAILSDLRQTHRLILITKGDLLDQHRKLAKSNLAGHFQQVEVVSEKDEETYAKVLHRHGISAAHFLMVGNSLKSDIYPVVSLGGFGIHVPYRITWELERVPPRADGSDRIRTLPSLADLPATVRELTVR